MTKMTYVEALNTAIATATLSTEVVDKLTALRNQIENKHVNRKPTAKQGENAAVKNIIMDYLNDGAAHTITEIVKGANFGETEVSNQRISALVRQLKDDGLIVRTEVKRVAYFAKA